MFNSKKIKELEKRIERMEIENNVPLQKIVFLLLKHMKLKITIVPAQHEQYYLEPVDDLQDTPMRKIKKVWRGKPE